MSPQSRRGRAAPPSHRKPASNPTTPAASKKAAPPVEAVAAEQLEEVRPVASKRDGKPIRRKRNLSQVRHSSAARYGGEWAKAYAPLFAVAIIAFFALWAWVSFGPHTPTPKDHWTQIESAWKPKRDAALQQASAAVAAKDLKAEIAAYTALRDDTQGWMDALDKITSWGGPTDTPPPGQTQTAVSVMAQFTSDGQTLTAEFNDMIKATTQNDLLANQDAVISDEESFQHDYWVARGFFTGQSEATPSLFPTFPLPAGTFVPPASPGASTSPGASDSGAASPTPAATATPVPSASASPS